jgi:HEAT repeat protein
MNMIEDLIEAARKEEWKTVDKEIPKVCDQDPIQVRALELLRDSDGNVRDLGASIFEKASRIGLGRLSRAIPVLKEIMIGDSNPYARYRSAFALAKHAPERYKQETIATLEEAKDDKDVGKIAREYLKRYK